MELRRENDQLKHLVADPSLKNVVLKKAWLAWRASRASGEVLEVGEIEIIRLVEQAVLPVNRTLAEFGLRRSTFYRWYSRYLEDRCDGLANRTGHDRRFWNRIPDEERRRVMEIALPIPELLPREVAFKVTDTEDWFISESSVYRILKSHDLITSPAFTVLSAADEFRHKTQRVHESW